MSSTVLKEFLDQFEKELTCSICNEIINDPKTLNCLHNYCYNCIEQWCETKTKARRLPTCPECRLIIDLPDGHATSLRSSFYLNSLLKLLQEMQSRNVEDHTRLECVSCEKASVVVAFCFQCNGVICEECVQAHKALKQLKLHEVVLLEQFKRENVEKYLKNQGFTLCKERFHEREILKFFCQDCKRSICQKCAILDHKDHSKMSVEEANEQAIQLIEKDLDLVCEKMGILNEELAFSEENMDRIQRNIDSVKEEVTNTVESVIKSIRGHEAALLATLNKTCRKQKAAHHRKQNNINDQINFSSEFTAFARAIIGRQLGSEILDNQESISERCKELSKKATSVPSEMKRNFTVEYVTNQEVVNSFQEIGKIVERVTDPESFSIKSLKEIRCGFVNEFEVVSKTCQKVCHATSELIGVKIKDCDLRDVPSKLRIRDGKFLVKYKAEKAGVYEINVTIGNQPVKNSPQIIKTLDYSGELSPVKLFGKQGTSEGEFHVPWSLAVSDNADPEIRRRQQLEAIKQRQKEAEGRGIQDPERLKRQQQKREYLEAVMQKSRRVMGV